MCVQCMIGAVAAGSAATGTRAWLAHRRPRWLTPARLKAVTVALIGAAVLVAGGILA